MLIAVPVESAVGETRVALVPDSIRKILKWEGASVALQSGAGLKSGYSDDMYREAGCEILDSREDLLKKADILVMVGKPEASDITQLSSGAALICQLDPFNEKNLISSLSSAGVTAVSLEMIPRSTIAQKMDVLSSQASLAGYMAVIKAAEIQKKVFPMMMTPAGTVSPSKVFVIGAGVAGLQAIATAKRLGASVSAFDTRPVVEEQVHSLGARFIKIDLGDTGQTKDGYARELTEEQLQKQRELMTKVCSQSDVVITTAKLFGRKAPVIINKEMIQKMSPGSLLVDMAVDSGGNVEGALPDQLVTVDGVHILGYGKGEMAVPFHASQMYSGNVTAFLETFWSPEAKGPVLEGENEILTGCVITRGGAIVHERFKEES
jgi:NAD(P) transhydrogenase subunit alpha